MIYGHRNAFSLPESHFSILNVPLLDNEFDPDEGEIFDHNEIFSLHTAEPEDDDFSL